MGDTVRRPKVVSDAYTRIASHLDDNPLSASSGKLDNRRFASAVSLRALAGCRLNCV